MLFVFCRHGSLSMYATGFLGILLLLWNYKVVLFHWIFMYDSCLLEYDFVALEIVNLCYLGFRYVVPVLGITIGSLLYNMVFVCLWYRCYVLCHFW